MESLLLTLLYQYPYYFRMVFIDESIATERDWMIVEIVFPSSSSVTPAVCSRGVLVPAVGCIRPSSQDGSSAVHLL